ncbi:hypothetical protein [Endozoicomonas sp. ALC020]|uniref:hypothetical protein n=1 Tax=Endozoicomonas sp. ALC020 TaxID=3403077 RepID=UPI003BAFCCE6
MTKTRPNALSLAVAVAIGSSIFGTEAFAERKLQTKSIDIPDNGHAEFTRSEVIVQPTLDDDLQPIPNSFTTTYPDQAQVRGGFDVPSEGFTEVLSGIEGGVSNIDLFETDENDIAQKYTKVLKVGNEGVFRFTHNLAEKELLIEVREGMTDQNSIAAVRTQLDDTQPLEPLTKVAGPEQLTAILKGANERSGNLGEVDNFVALATIEVDEVDVEGRTFMRLIAAGDQPTKLQRLGLSLFVNDEALFAAATSAYTQVHVLGEDLQKEALNDLLSYHQPVGYVLHFEDESQSYRLPAGYPKLEVEEVRGGVIVFRSQKQNPADIAFVESLYNLWREDDANNPTPVTAKVKKDKVKSYQYVIRNRQMELLEELAEQYDTVVGRAELITLTYYESLQQALTNASPDQADDFELTIEDIRQASSGVTTTWVQNQLEKHFGFKPIVKDLLANQLFIQDIQKVVTAINQAHNGAPGVEGKFASSISKQLVKIESMQEELQTEARRLTRLRDQLKLTLKATTSVEKQLRALQLKRQVEDALAENRKLRDELQNPSGEIQQEVKGVLSLEQQIRNARAGALPIEERLIKEKIRAIYRPFAATAKSYEEALKAEPGAIGGEPNIASVDEDNLSALQFVQQQLKKNSEEFRKNLAIFEVQLGLVTNNEDDLQARYQAILQHLQEQRLEAVKQHGQNQQEQEELKNWLEKLQQEAKRIQQLEKNVGIARAIVEEHNTKEAAKPGIDNRDNSQPLEEQVYDARADATKDRNAQTAAELGIDNWDDTLPLEQQARLIRKKIQEIKPPDFVTEQTDEKTVKAQLAGIGNKRRLISANEDQLETRQQSIPEHFEQNEQKDWIEKLQKKADLVPLLKKLVHTLSRNGRKAKYALSALNLGIDDWDDNLPLDKQFGLIVKKFSEIYASMAAAGQSDEGALTAEPAAIGGWRGIASVNQYNPNTLLFIQQRLQQNEITLPKSEVRKKLTIFENYLGLVPENKDDLEARHQAIHQHLKQQAAEIARQPVQNQLEHESDRIQELEQQVRDARADATKARNAQLAAELAIDDWDDSQPPEEQARLIRKKIAEMKPSVAATGKPDEAAATAKPAAIGGKRSMTTINGDDLDTLEFVQQRELLPQNEGLTDQEIRENLSFCEGKLGLVPDNEDDLETRHRGLQQRIQEQSLEIEQQFMNFLDEHDGRKTWLQLIKKQVDRIPILKKEARAAVPIKTQKYNAQLAAVLGIDGWDDTQPIEEQFRLIREKIQEIKQPVTATSIAPTPVTGDTGEEVGKTDNTRRASEPGTDDRDDTQALEKKTRLISHKIHKIKQSVSAISIATTPLSATPLATASIAPTPVSATPLATTPVIATGAAALHSREETLKEKPAAIERKQAMTPEDENDPDARYRLLQPHLQNMLKLTDQAILNKDTALENRAKPQSTLQDRLLRLSELEKELQTELEDIRTPGHPRAMPEVFGTLRAVERVLEQEVIYRKEDDVYFHRLAVSEGIRMFITEAKERSEENALISLYFLEKILDLQSNEGDDKAARLERVRTRLDGGDISNYKLVEMIELLWCELDRHDLEALKGDLPETNLKLFTIRERLAFAIEESDQRAIEKQAEYLLAIEDQLAINPHKNPAAIERGKAFTAKLAGDLQLEFEQDDNLSDQKDALKDKIQALREEVNEIYHDEGGKRISNNQIADRLNIENYGYHASINEQKSLIGAKLDQLDEEVFKAGQSGVNERIATIENELDKQMARLGPKPRYVLDRDVARARWAIKLAENDLDSAHRKLHKIGDKHLVFAWSLASQQHLSDEEKTVINRAMKEFHTHLGLDSGDSQPPQERMENVKHYLRGCSQEQRDNIVKELRAKTNRNIEIKGNVLSFTEEHEEFIVDLHKKIPGLYGTGKFGGSLGELASTRIKNSLVRQFLVDHDRKNLKVTNAWFEKRNAQQKLDLKKEEIKRCRNTDDMAETIHKNEIARLNLALKLKSKEVSKAEEDLTDFHKTSLAPLEKTVGLKPDATDTSEHRVNALRHKQVQLGGHDGTGGRIRQLIQEQARLKGEIKAGKAKIERRKEILKTAEKAVEEEDGPFQYTPRQVKALDAIHKFSKEHPLKKQAIQAAIGLQEAAAYSGKPPPNFIGFDFDDEFAPIRLRAKVGNKLRIQQAGQIVEMFRSLETAFPLPLLSEDRSRNVLREIQTLTTRAWIERNIGAKEFGDEIRSIGSAVIHCIEHQQRDLKDFSEYFAAHSASGGKIIALLRDGLINKVELENYMKAVRGIDGYLPADEFEHALGYRHKVNVPRFRAVVQRLDNEVAEEFMQSAFANVAVTAAGPTGMTESVVGMKEYAAAVIANYVLDDIAFENGRKTTAFLANVQDTLTPYANAAGLAESELIKIINSTLVLAHAAAVEQQLNEYWLKPSAYLVQAVTWYYTSYKPLLMTYTAWHAADLALSSISFLYLMDLTNRGDYTHRMLTPFQHWLERYGVDLDRIGQYAYHREIEKFSEVGGLAMPLGKATSSAILLRTGSMLFARQYNANPHRYRSIYRLMPEIVKSMGSGQGVQVPLLHRVTPQAVKGLASVTAGLVLGPISTAGAYAQGLLSGFTYAQTFGFALASSLAFDFFMNDNKMLTQWLGGPLGRGIDRINRWRGVGETDAEYVKRTAVATPQRFNETGEDYVNRVKASNSMPGWTRHENYLHFRERRDRTMKMFENGWEKYFRENVPKWSFSHAESVPYSYTLGVFYEWQKVGESTRQQAATGSATPVPRETPVMTSVEALLSESTKTSPVTKTEVIPPIILDEFRESSEPVPITTATPTAAPEKSPAAVNPAMAGLAFNLDEDRGDDKNPRDEL